MSGIITRRLVPISRSVISTPVRQAHHEGGGIAGSSLPFGIKNKYFLILGCGIYIAVPVSIPFLMLKRACERG
ncbi:UNVERIFIED_CONTAM: hypothetical protein PYX00_010066 [Menopon gallinae]|uniref:Uncharacterized protein n=1 Tax=Menopon gallinae TaxID=328185 RepID=A0AAW2HED3_9NEOP